MNEEMDETEQAEDETGLRCPVCGRAPRDRSDLDGWAFSVVEGYGQRFLATVCTEHRDLSAHLVVTLTPRGQG